MLNSILTKEEFCNIIEQIRDVNDYQDGLNTYFKNHHCDGHLFQPDCTLPLISVLTKMFQDKGEWISYFCFDLDFGRKYQDGMVMDITGNNIPLKDASDLYSLLLANIS